jgi:hypothetical protein
MDDHHFSYITKLKKRKKTLDQICPLPNTTLWTLTRHILFFHIYPFFHNTLLTILKYFKISKRKSELMSDLLHDYQQWKNLSSGLPCTKRLFDYQPLLGYFYLYGVINLIIHICLWELSLKANWSEICENRHVKN